jgi:hypothetical protein
MDTIKAYQADICPYPEITILGLRDNDRRTPECTILHAPTAMSILGYANCRIEREGGGTMPPSG